MKNGVTKTYSWTMANMLAGVDSDDVNDTDVSYSYRGDLKRVWRWEDGNVLTSYNWDAGFNVVSEEDVGTPNTLARTYVAGLAEIIGSNPATGTPRYLTHDHLGSTRGVFDGTKASLGTFEYTPYGNAFAFTGPGDITQLFTGHDLDAITGNYFAPFRYLNPDAGRWLKRDPLGMIDGPNMYNYVTANPLNWIDPFGLRTWTDDEVQDALDQVRCAAQAGPIQGLANLAFIHGPTGPFDMNTGPFKNDKFPVNGRNLNASEFGNYLAGYGGASYGAPGLLGAYAGGIALDFFDGGRTRWDNDGSRKFIKEGARDARKRKKKKKQKYPTPMLGGY